MSSQKTCPKCGAKIAAGDRFCGDCGAVVQSPSPPATGTPTQAPPPKPVPPPAPVQSSAPPVGSGSGPPAGGGHAGLGYGNRNKNALAVVISLLVLLFATGGGLYWWLSRGEDTGRATPPAPTAKESTAPTTGGQATSPTPAPASGQASTSVPSVVPGQAAAYLPEPGLKFTFLVNYPDGTSGVIERVSARVAPNEAVRVSEVETAVQQGQALGFGFHYVERPGGTYCIADQTPGEIFPVLKNNPYVGQSWGYRGEYGQITWTVVDMGVNLDLGFVTFENCLLLQEDNQAAGFQSVTYYAPGRGSVKVINPGGTTDYYKMTALAKVDPAQAAQTVIKWSPNYATIKDDRTQR